ncbi:PAS domain-containing protein, partial [Terrisporobacter sp.]|uniref:PAS domain-containing protein n=1 Tax=Terrisporobacter sp. TaxID=1965305 RepID=UPI003990FB97
MNKNKLHINKKYISKIIYDIKEESIMGKCVKEEIKDVNDKIFRIVGVINIPIIIIKCCNHKCIFKNKYFDEFLLEHNYELKDFNVEDFIENFVKLNSKEIFKKIKQMDFSKENFLSMDIDDKKYKIVMVKDYLEGEEILICEMKDVTQVSMEEEKLKRSELRYKTLMDVLTDGVIIHDGNNVSYINKIALDIFDLNSSINNVWTIDKIMKKVCKKNKDNFRYNIFTMKNDSQNEQKSQIELENGKIFNIMSSTFILNNEKMILTIVSDFTQNKISLNKLEENKKTYYALLQTLPEGIILVNRYTKKQVYANKYMMRILKDMGMEKFNEIIDSYISSKENSNFKTFYINPNINKKISIAIKQVPNQNNLLVVVRDLQIEQQMEVVYNNLQLIKERNKFKTEFLIRVSSNLKKPINTIFEVNKFLDSKKDIYNYDGMKNYTKTVKQNSYRLKRLLNNIEEISEIESGIYYRNYKTYD